MANSPENAQPARVESGWFRWLWRWTPLQFGVAVTVFGALRLVPAALVDPLLWVVLGVVALIIVVGFVLVFGALFSGRPASGSPPVDSAWERLSHTQRRGISRALRRGDPIEPEHHAVAARVAERSIRAALPQATAQGALGALWLVNGGHEDWWANPQTIAGLVFTALGAGFAWWVSRLRRSLTRLQAQQPIENGSHHLDDDTGNL
ncbi:hypothetical protein [Pseudonocardia endophytica]|uniref:Uncharacterized protein n=1 Tax=Pseudonocardia endophytica TaxID=401976 RepID=A0A4R1I3P7_PSEEN|nr:hypothetical protein [Pseudonocardia endophytica]TCK24622.1 hypothetical protein EV378_0397 [Pseudonocardia endophytica]